MYVDELQERFTSQIASTLGIKKLTLGRQTTSQVPDAERIEIFGYWLITVQGLFVARVIQASCSTIFWGTGDKLDSIVREAGDELDLDQAILHPNLASGEDDSPIMLDGEGDSPDYCRVVVVNWKGHAQYEILGANSCSRSAVVERFLEFRTILEGEGAL
ncbi:hypothetical protein M4951_22985 [Blastopirellula sp. J2-11]|uniref:hypothetical protein n=1 Tax=Blastopirellula sp. J2-11 TaxID=2943192 RepID=UPI0021C697A9|nr:hypothetical protein [Blastopirellula sp. J2-11]UUO06208.1 hypothetical protein M4951_22985 [Blastopirellula sp. J2-11]